MLGTLDLEAALAHGEKRFEPGLLARAHRGSLYIDEINLLEDHVVDLLLDVCASGENLVERDGLSVRHPARFVLIGSGNPEEGELRPQLLDRFGLSVEVRTPQDIGQRVEIMRRCNAQEQDPSGFARQWADEDTKVLKRIARAQKLLSLAAVTANPTGAYAFGLLLVFRLSSKLNIYWGVPNLSDELLPMHLAYLKSYFGPKRLRPMLGLSTVAIVGLAGYFGLAAFRADQPAELAQAGLLCGLSLLAALEHLFLGLPFRDSALWSWAMEPRGPQSRTSMKEGENSRGL